MPSTRQIQQPFYVGVLLLAEGEFRLAGVPTDPLIVRGIVLHPNGQRDTLVYPHASLVRRSLGSYELSFRADEAGIWRVRFEGDGTVAAVNELTVEVRPSLVL